MFFQQCRFAIFNKTGEKIPLRPVHTKHDNYKDSDKDIVLKIILNIKE